MSAQNGEKRRWLGVLLSILVPGFGVYRSGRRLRGLIWFGVISLAPFMYMAFAVSKGEYFIWLAFAVAILSIILSLWMYVDSFKSGKVTKKGWGLFTVLLLFSVLVPDAFQLIGKFHRIVTAGMYPTLNGLQDAEQSDYIISSSLAYQFSEPERGDIVTFSIGKVPNYQKSFSDEGFKTSEDSIFIQRIVALPGEHLEIKNGDLFINGKRMTPSEGVPELNYTLPVESSILKLFMEKGKRSSYTLSHDEYFTIGDNTENSLDGRYWGTIPKEAIEGKAIRIIYPFARIRNL